MNQARRRDDVGAYGIFSTGARAAEGASPYPRFHDGGIWLLELEGAKQDLGDLALVLLDDRAEITREGEHLWLKSEADFDGAAAFAAWSRRLVAMALHRSEIVFGRQLEIRIGRLEECARGRIR